MGESAVIKYKDSSMTVERMLYTVEINDEQKVPDSESRDVGGMKYFISVIIILCLIGGDENRWNGIPG